MVRRKPKAGRAETALGATRPWRESALAEIARRGRGAHAATAKAVGCKPPTLTQLLNGQIAVSPLVGLVSDYLGIPRPGEVVRSADEIEVHEGYPELEPNGRKLVLDLIRQLRPIKNTNK